MLTRSCLILLAGLVAVGCGGGDDAFVSQDEVDLRTQVADEAISGKEDSWVCSGINMPDRSGFAHRIALTFDDGPKMATTPKVLEILAKHEAKATFFVVGSSIQTTEQKELIKTMKAAGHTIGSHSQNHLDLKRQTAAKIRQQVEATQDVLKALGIEDPYFRFPYGSADCEATEIVRSYGYKVIGWQFGSQDWCYVAGGGYCSPATASYVPDQYRSDMVGFSIAEAKRTGGGIMVFHDVHQLTVDHLDTILTRLEDEGFTFVGLDDTTAFPKLNGVVPAPQPWVGKVCSTVADCTFAHGGQDGMCYTFTASGDEAVHGFCTLPCTGYCPDLDGYAPTFCTSMDETVGLCVSKAVAQNGDCDQIPGTTPREMDRFIGSSTASEATALVCVP